MVGLGGIHLGAAEPLFAGRQSLGGMVQGGLLQRDEAGVDVDQGLLGRLVELDLIDDLVSDQHLAQASAHRPFMPRRRQ